MNTYKLLSNEYLITSQSQFLNKLNELLDNGYFFNEKDNINVEELLLDVSNWGEEFLQYDKILSEKSYVHILFFKIIEENKLFQICSKIIRK